MECHRVDEMVNEHGLEKLSAAAKAELDAHVEHCGRCADVLLSHELLRDESLAGPRAGCYEQARAGAFARSRIDAAVRPARHLAPALGLAASALLAVVLVGRILPVSLSSNESASPILDSGLATDAPVSTELPTELDAPTPTGTVAPPPALPAAGNLGNTPTGFAPAIPGFLAGIHYENLPELAPTTSGDDKVEVCEFFMFMCIHCYNLESELTAWVGQQGEAVELVRVPAIWHPVSRLHAQAYFTAEVLGVHDEIVAPFYAEIHDRGNPLETRAAVRAFFGRQGIDGASFDRSFDSPDVLARLARAEELNRLYRVDSTPSIGVNGRYLTTTAMAGSTERLFDVVDALVEAEAEAQAELRACEEIVDGDASVGSDDAVAMQACRIQQFRRWQASPMPRAPF